MEVSEFLVVFLHCFFVNEHKGNLFLKILENEIVMTLTFKLKLKVVDSYWYVAHVDQKGFCLGRYPEQWGNVLVDKDCDIFDSTFPEDFHFDPVDELIDELFLNPLVGSTKKIQNKLVPHLW